MSTTPVSKKDHPEPTPRHRAAMARAQERIVKRPAPLAYKVEQSGDRLGLEAPHGDVVGHTLHAIDTFGTASMDFKDHCVGRLAAVMRGRGEALPNEKWFNASLAAIGGIAPENEVEAMLAVQIVGTHEVAMEMLTRAKQATTPEQVERFGSLATKMLRTYTTQLEALAKLRRGGTQKVTVEHVHVYEGGQAIVGNVNTGGRQGPAGGRGQYEDDHQAHALAGPAALALQADPSMLCEDAGRDALPVAGGAGEGAVPDARRGRRKRSAGG